MKQNLKKLVIIFLLLTVAVSLASADSTRAIHRNTPIYANADFDSEIIFYIPQNADVVLEDEVVNVGAVRWQKVNYAGYVGYVDSANLYTFKGEVKYSVTPVKATSTKMGENINLYMANSTESTVVHQVKDGEKLLLIDNGVDYGDFFRVEYNGETLFVRKGNVTNKLTYNQLTAVIVLSSVAGLALVVAIGIILRRKNAKD